MNQCLSCRQEALHICTDKYFREFAIFDGSILFSCQRQTVFFDWVII